VFYDLGFLSEVKVVECFATQFIGQYVGQTGPKTIQQLERGLGKVLFVDEAYRLSDGLFAQEAVDELVDTMTKPRFAGKLVIILAGYDNDMNNLLRVNEGLNSRFSEEIIFPSLSPDHCLRLLEAKIHANKVSFPILHNSSVHQNFSDLVEQLTKLPAWGNARDIETLAKSMVREVFKVNLAETSQLVLSEETAMICVQAMLTAKRGRSIVAPTPTPRPSLVGESQTLDAIQMEPSASFHSSTNTTNQEDIFREDVVATAAIGSEPGSEFRDAGVSDALWQQLQNDQNAFEHQTQESMRQLQAQEEAVRVAAEKENLLAEEVAIAALREAQAKDEAERLELLRLQELARIKAMEAKAERERIQQERDKQRQMEFKRREKEEQAQKKLRDMGVCEAGYRWIKQTGGYMCAGGAHYVSDMQLSM
jgi:hypothetical protein